MGLMFLGTPYLIRFLNRKSIKRIPTLGQEINWQFDEDNISATMPEGDFSAEWASLKDSLIANNGALIYPQIIHFTGCPNRPSPRSQILSRYVFH